jgi:serine/threonine protein kinase
MKNFLSNMKFRFVLFQVCGSLPFENEEEITGQKLVLKSHLTTELKNLIQRCLAQNPDRRPSLESILEHAWLKN